MSVWLLLLLNRLFPLPRHPFNTEVSGELSYTQWQFQMGHRTIEFFEDYTDPRDMFASRRVLDIGCGGGGKTCYYATLGAREVCGVDPVSHYRLEAEEFARKMGLDDRVYFITADAAKLPHPDGKFDTVIMNDTFEHLDEPRAVLRECARVMAPGGRLFLNFPPYYHPYGAHLSDAIGIPWVHVLFSEKTMIEAYRRLVSPLPDAKRRLRLRLGDDPEAQSLSYINRMTARRFRRILEEVPFEVLYHREYPLRSFLKPLTYIPIVREGFLRMVVAVLRPATGMSETTDRPALP
ncbi:MAG: methyltransferase domain-containing protein [Clostridia bacterium]